MFYLAIGLHKGVYRNFLTKISWHGGKIAPILLVCATAPRELDLILTLCLAKLAERTSTLAQVLLQIHKQTHILWIEIIWEKTFEWVHSILVDEHTFEALDQGLWSFLSVDFAPAYQRISTWVIGGITRNCVHIKKILTLFGTPGQSAWFWSKAPKQIWILHADLTNLFFVYNCELWYMKHCQRHNGPEGWVHIKSSNTNLDQISSSESRPSINFKITTKHQPLHKT